MRSAFRLIAAGVILTAGVGFTAHARDGVPKLAPASIGTTYPTVFVSACRFVKAGRQTKYASDLNMLTGLKAGSLLIYVYDIGRDGPRFRKIGNQDISYTAFNLFIANKLKNVSHRGERATGKTGFGDKRQIEIYTRPDGVSFKIEWLASVTFDNDSGRGGYLEGQGGTLSNAEYDDIVTSVQKQPFLLVHNWHRILEMTVRACDIRWTETDRYISTH